MPGRYGSGEAAGERGLEGTKKSLRQFSGAEIPAGGKEQLFALERVFFRSKDKTNNGHYKQQTRANPEG